MLADITADEIKIDRAFISNIHQRPRSQSILRAIESVSQAVGMTVIAEGVESFEELAYLLRATRIRYAQGYYSPSPSCWRTLSRPAVCGVTSASTRQGGRGCTDAASARPGHAAVGGNAKRQANTAICGNCIAPRRGYIIGT